MSIVLVWPGGEHQFALGIGELEALQGITGEGPGASLDRLWKSLEGGRPSMGPWKIADVLDVTRLGLIGGGLDPLEARKLVKGVVDRFGIIALVPVAGDVLMDALKAREDEDPGELEGQPQPKKNGTSQE